MGHYHRFKRGDLVVIVSGRYEGHQGVVDSAVFQRTIDYPDEFAPGYYRRGIILADGPQRLRSTLEINPSSWSQVG